MTLARFLIRAEAQVADAAAGGKQDDEVVDHAAVFAELTGPNFVACLAAAGALAALIAVGAFGPRNQSSQLVSGAVVATLVVACAHAHKTWRHINRPAASYRWLVARHRGLLLLLGTVCSIAYVLQYRRGLSPTLLPIVYAMLVVGAVGAVSAAVDQYSLLIWIGTVVGIPLLAELAMENGAGTAAPALSVGAVIITGLAVQIHLLSVRARRARSENDLLISQLRRQVTLVEAANEEKTRFLGAASHDLRQPMHALGLFAAALEKELRGSVHHEPVVRMERAVDALEKSFDAMLDVSKLDAGVVEPDIQTFPLRDMFCRLHMQCAGHAEEKGLSLRFKAGGKLITSDPQLLERVLGNLIHNAIRCTSAGGVTVIARSRGGRTSLEIWDTGSGIPESELERIFNEFYQVANASRDRTKGLGMGLSIVKRLIVLLGYELEVASELGRGSAFKVLVPATQLAELPSIVVGADTIPSPPEKGRVALVIDDEEPVREGMRTLLTGWGYTVLLAGSIAEVRSAVRSHPGLIDVIVSDLRLGKGEDGLDAVEQARQAYGAPLPAILVTGDTSPDEVKRAHGSGHPVLFKPVRPRDLFAALRHAP